MKYTVEAGVATTLNRQLYGALIYETTVDEYADSDMSYAVFSVLFVFLYMWFHLRSFLLAVYSIFMILESFPITQVIYRGILKIEFYQTLTQLSIFMVLGVAADDIFVLVDAWRQTRSHPLLAKSQRRRMAYAFNRANSAMIVTSSTTTVAFLANALSEILPIRTFGIFAAIIIPLNYILVVTVLPSMLILHERHLLNRNMCCIKQ